MGRKPNVSEPTRWASLILLLIGLVSCSMVYMFVSLVLRPSVPANDSDVESLALAESYDNGEKWVNGVESGGATGGLCCKGIDNLELWGAAVKWGTDFKFNSSGECCRACKAMCTGNDGPCLCDTWVFCGNKQACGNKFGECWLKKQKDLLAPEKQEVGNKVTWTSGLVFGRGEGIIGFETEHGTLHIKGAISIEQKVVVNLGMQRKTHQRCFFGPPFALVQGTLEAQGMTFNKIPSEYCPTMRRGSVAWVGSGPEFFISLANHEEWKNSYTVFGSVLPEDLLIAEKIAQLPTKSDVWNNINVSVLENPVPLRIQRMKISVS